MLVEASLAYLPHGAAVLIQSMLTAKILWVGVLAACPPDVVYFHLRNLAVDSALERRLSLSFDECGHT